MFVQCESFSVSIFIAGDYDQARQVCREFCLDYGWCVTVTPTQYIYTGGEEAGVVVGIINYPRFPAAPEEIFNKAQSLAERLIHVLCQHSYTIQTPAGTYWHSRRSAA